MNASPSLPESLTMLDRIEQALAEAMPQAHDETANATVFAPSPVPVFDQRLDQWQECLQRVEEQADRAAEELEQGADDLRAWRQQAARIREALHEWEKRVV